MWSIQQVETEYRREQLIQDWGTGTGWWRRLFARHAEYATPLTRTASSEFRAAAKRPAGDLSEPHIPVQAGPVDSSREERTTVGSSAA